MDREKRFNPFPRLLSFEENCRYNLIAFFNSSICGLQTLLKLPDGIRLPCHRVDPLVMVRTRNVENLHCLNAVQLQKSEGVYLPLQGHKR